MLVRAFALSVLLVVSLAHADEVEAPSASEISPWRFEVGLGMTARWRREVNPAVGDWASSPRAFATAWYRHFGLSLEYGPDGTRTTSSGAFRVRTEGRVFGAWGRYGWANWNGVTPFVSLGGGATFENIRTEFQSIYDQRNASRRFVGLGAGISARVFRFVVAETEARLISEVYVKFPGVAVLLKVGVGF